jgi:hypothetical protein
VAELALEACRPPRNQDRADALALHRAVPSGPPMGPRAGTSAARRRVRATRGDLRAQARRQDPGARPSRRAAGAPRAGSGAAGTLAGSMNPCHISGGIPAP